MVLCVVLFNHILPRVVDLSHVVSDERKEVLALFEILSWPLNRDHLSFGQHLIAERDVVCCSQFGLVLHEEVLYFLLIYSSFKRLNHFLEVNVF